MFGVIDVPGFCVKSDQARQPAAFFNAYPSPP
jgi:hypothetical protein